MNDKFFHDFYRLPLFRCHAKKLDCTHSIQCNEYIGTLCFHSIVWHLFEDEPIAYLHLESSSGGESLMERSSSLSSSLLDPSSSSSPTSDGTPQLIFARVWQASSSLSSFGWYLYASPWAPTSSLWITENQQRIQIRETRTYYTRLNKLEWTKIDTCLGLIKAPIGNKINKIN